MTKPCKPFCYNRQRLKQILRLLHIRLIIEKPQKASWLRSTFTDVKGNPSFKRQILFLLVITVISGSICNISIEYIKQLVLLAGSIGLGVASEQFSKH